jgi:hypothetical protein
MAVTASGLFVNPWISDMLGLHVLNWDLETHKCALYANTITPNFSDTNANARYGAGAFATGEVSGTGYTAGGATVTSTTVTESPTSVLMFDAADTAWASSTITNARCGLIYADAITTPNADPAMVLINFGADYSTNNGTFTIQWAATGIFTWDVY